MSLTTVTVTETFLPDAPGGTVPSGEVTFTLSERIHDGSGNEVPAGQQVVAPLSHAATITGTATSGSGALIWNGLTTGALTATSTAAQVLAALKLLAGFPQNATASGGALGTAPVVVTIPGDPSVITVSVGTLTGGSWTVAEAASISAPLYANDDTTTVPTGSFYTVTFQLAGVSPVAPIEITVPHTAGSGTCTLASLS